MIDPRYEELPKPDWPCPDMAPIMALDHDMEWGRFVLTILGIILAFAAVGCLIVAVSLIRGWL